LIKGDALIDEKHPASEIIKVKKNKFLKNFLHLSR
jgi:hypothetical protein